MEDYLRFVATGSVIAFAITDINLILTTVILLLTALYWMQRNYRMYVETRAKKKLVNKEIQTTTDES